LQPVTIIHRSSPCRPLRCDADTNFAWDWADRAVVLEAGRVIALAAPAVVLTDRDVLDRACLDRPAAAGLKTRL